jgi:hypothetical protein
MTGKTYEVAAVEVAIVPEIALYSIVMTPKDGEPFALVMKPSVALRMAQGIQTPKEIGLTRPN